MESDRTWQAQWEAFLQSELGGIVIRPGAERALTEDFQDWIRSFNLDRWEAATGFEEYLATGLESFLAHEAGEGYLEPTSLDELEFEPGLWDTLHGLAEVAVEARYEAEVVRGVQEDMRVSPEDAREAAITEAPRSLMDRIETLMQVIDDFVRGRDGHERSDELSR
jgi:hypothetical protein